MLSMESSAKLESSKMSKSVGGSNREMTLVVVGCFISSGLADTARCPSSSKFSKHRAMRPKSGSRSRMLFQSSSSPSSASSSPPPAAEEDAPGLAGRGEGRN